MDVHLYAWLATVAGLVVVLVGGLILDHRNPHEVTMKEATRGIIVYVSLAVLFGIGVWIVAGGRYAGEFFTGYIVEYSLSIDNLFVFVVIMTRFAVPRRAQHEVLLVGIVLALVLRGLFIAVGATAIAHFSWIFYVFGAFLIFTAIQMARHRGEDQNDVKDNILLRIVQRRLPATTQYDGLKLVTVIDGKRLFTPMVIVMVAIGSTDLLFAVDSIPAIFGITKEAYLVFTANMFALMGLRQLYFLIGGLLDRLIYLTLGLSVILGFIGVKLLLEALHGSGLHVPLVPTWMSLVVILVVLAITTAASLLKKSDPAQEEQPADAEQSTEAEKPVEG
ncbi:MAG: TerC/Alx family metal homeostasis membrane protein [Streptosporangiales bacterium]|nr:TerC/Alx family metal homeostasis membrane protein [Streptosporangiales bacterium]